MGGKLLTRSIRAFAIALSSAVIQNALDEPGLSGTCGMSARPFDPEEAYKEETGPRYHKGHKRIDHKSGASSENAVTSSTPHSQVLPPRPSVLAVKRFGDGRLHERDKDIRSWV